MSHTQEIKIFLFVTLQHIIMCTTPFINTSSVPVVTFDLSHVCTSMASLVLSQQFGNECVNMFVV